MSQFRTGFEINGSDFAEYFPPCEYFQFDFTKTVGVSDYVFDINLQKNKTNSTNYAVFCQVYSDTNSSISQKSTSTYKPMFLNKTAASVRVYMRNNTTFQWTGKIWCLVVYLPDVEQAVYLESMSGYQQAGQTLNQYLFPQTVTQIKNYSAGTTVTDNAYNTFLMNITTNYMFIYTIEHQSGSIGDTPMYINNAMLLEPKSNTIYQICFRSGTTAYVNMYSMTIYTDTTSTNDSSIDYFVSINEQSYALTTIFPSCEFIRREIGSTFTDTSFRIYLSKNTSATTFYMVFPTFYYRNTTPSATNYTIFEASSATNYPIVYNRTSTYFDCAVSGAGAKVFDGGVDFLVVYV